MFEHIIEISIISTVAFLPIFARIKPEQLLSFLNLLDYLYYIYKLILFFFFILTQSKLSLPIYALEKKTYNNNQNRFYHGQSYHLAFVAVKQIIFSSFSDFQMFCMGLSRIKKSKASLSHMLLIYNQLLFKDHNNHFSWNYRFNSPPFPFFYFLTMILNS